MESLKSKTGEGSLSSLLFLGETIAVFGGLWYVQTRGLISRDLFFLLTVFVSFMWALYYGIKGAAAAVLGSALLVLAVTKGQVFMFLSLRFKETGFFLATVMITGFVRTNFERRSTGMDLTNLVLNKRVDKLTVELSERDRALQDAFHEVLSDMESPRIMYQGLRRLEHLTDRETFFDEILYLLYTHCHVEKSAIYEVVDEGAFRRVTSFGGAGLPEMLRWKDPEIPEIVRVAASEREVIIPKQLDNRLVMSIPILSSSEVLRYLLVLEEIRFINLSEGLIDLLKVAAFWIKAMIESRLHRDELLAISVYSSVIVYNPEVSSRILEETITRYSRYGLPFSLLRVRGPVTEENAGRLSSSLRLYDEIFMPREDELILFLSMADERNSKFVIQRLSAELPDLQIEGTANPAPES